ncbi:threonine/serine dehydratase [Chloroflexota bacterium]
MIPLEWIESAAERISNHIIHTPVTFDKSLNIFLKWENQQKTGSFKVRGALNRVFLLEPWEREQGLVTASAGNHGQGIALAAQLIGAKTTVFVSDHAVKSKVDAMKDLGADIRPVNGGYGLSEKIAIEYSEKLRATYVSPYNDPQIIAGQGTIGLEVLADIQFEEPVTWVVPVGGGGLISGLGVVRKFKNITGPLVGIQPETSAFTNALYHKGSQEGISDDPTLADGLSGPMQEGSITLPIIRNVVDDILTVTENEIKNAIAYAWDKYNEVIEGSAAVSLAAVLSNKVGTPALIMITGGNIQNETHLEIIEEYL